MRIIVKLYTLLKFKAIMGTINNLEKRIIRKLRVIKRSINRPFLSPSGKRHELVGPPNLWKMKRDFQIKFLKNYGLQKSDKLLDIGCGTLRGGIPIIQYLEKGNYYGIEVRKEVLAEGEKELKDHNLEQKNPNLISFSKFSNIDLQTKFDVILAFSVLIHLEDNIAENCFEFVNNRLSINGRFFFNVNLGIQRDENWQGFPLVYRSLKFYEDLTTKNGLTLRILGKLIDLGHKSGIKSQDNQVMLEVKKK